MQQRGGQIPNTLVGGDAGELVLTPLKELTPATPEAIEAQEIRIPSDIEAVLLRENHFARRFLLLAALTKVSRRPMPVAIKPGVSVYPETVC